MTDVIKMQRKNIVIYALLGACALLFVEERWIKDVFFKELAKTTAISLATTAFIYFFSSHFQEKNVEEILLNYFPIINTCHKYGLIDISTRFPVEEIKFEKDIIHSKHVTIVMNDGKSFISSNAKLLKDRVQVPGHSTDFILQDYLCDDIMSVLTRKNGHEGTYYKDKIKTVVDYDIGRLNKEEKHCINVYFNSNYNTMAIILTDNYAMISLYRVASGKSTVPHLVFKKGHKEYAEISFDVNNLKKNCRKQTL